jgi:hypothetical protein
MKRKLFLLLCALLTMIGVQNAQAYTESDLTDAGWEEVTPLNMDNATLSQYYYVFYSVEGDNLMLAQGIVSGYQENLLTGVYRTAANPIENPQMVWMIDYSEDFKYGLRNLSNPVPYMQSRNDEGPGNPGPWTIQFNAAWSPTQNKWTRFNLAYSGGSWTIENNAANDNEDSDPYKDKFIGPWVENASSFSDGKAVAGNKPKNGDYVGHFKLYRMEKAVYYGKKYYPEFTAVTSTDQLTDLDMAANYYIIVAETNPDLAVTARNKEDANVRLKYVTQSVFTNAAQIWTLQANDGGYSFRNLKKDHALLQAHTAAWGTNIANEQAAVAHTKFELTSDGNTGFTILNSSFPGNYLGLWTPAHGYKSGENMAANKSGNNIAHFYIYSIPRSVYKTQFLDNNSEVTDIFMTNPHVENAYGWGGTKKTFDKEYFDGAPDNICLDLNYSGNTYQFVTLPAGNYLLKVATRGISNADAGIYVKVKVATPGPGDDLVNVQVQKKNNAGNELGNGWGWTYLSFSIAEEKELEIGFFVNSGFYAGADDFHLYKNNNVVTMNETSTSVDFSAGKHANVFMNRNITAGKWATLCLPFAMAKPNDWEVRELSSVEESNGVYTLHFTEAASLEAGKPYMVKTTEDVTRIVATDVTVLTEPVDQTVDGVTMKGVFTSGYVPSGGYFVSGNKFYRAADNTNSMKAFRAYFEINGSSNARSLILNIDEATSVTTLDGQQSATAQPEAVFDLSGRRQTRLMPGINIVRQADGTVKKVFVK